MVALLLIRSATDIPVAVAAVNEFLAYRRSRNGSVRDDEILAVCLRGDLDAGLPICHAAEEPPAASGAVPPGGGLGIRESFSVSGIWSLCWVDGGLLHVDADARRDAILRMLVESPSPPGPLLEPGVAFPVFGASEPVACVEAEVRTLKARYPRFMGASWYCDDEIHGIVTGG